VVGKASVADWFLVIHKNRTLAPLSPSNLYSAKPALAFTTYASQLVIGLENVRWKHSSSYCGNTIILHSLVQVGAVDQILWNWQVIVSEPLVISYPVRHVYVTVSSYLVPVLVIADEFAFCTTVVLPQLISTTSMGKKNGCI